MKNNQQNKNQKNLEEELKMWQVYESTLGNKNIGKVVYVGWADRRGLKYRHTIIFNNENNFPDCIRFRNYSLDGNKLHIPYTKNFYESFFLHPGEDKYAEEILDKKIPQKKNA